MLKPHERLDGRYVIISVIGSGGQGIVYLASDTKLGTRCAIKEIDLYSNTSLDLLAEPEILKKLKYPALPRILDIIRTPNYLYIVEEYFEGTSLKDLIPNRAICNEGNIILWITDLAEILHYLHSVLPHPIIYRDMKPSNVIIDREGRVRLVDFGIARHYKAGQDSDTKHIGTHGYAAPEQYGSNQTDARSDIYSLGVTIYHAITGKSPLEPPYEMLPIRQVNPHLSEGLETIISRCVRVDPNQRYQSASDLLNDIKNIHTMNRSYQQQKLKQKLAVVAVLFLLVAGGFAGAKYYQSLQDEKTAQYEQYLQAGTEAYKSGKFDEAEVQFNKAMAIKQNDEVYIDLARTYLREGKNEKVISFLQENINHGQLNSNSEVKYLTGTAYFNMKDFEKAVWYFKDAVKNGQVGMGDDYAAAYRDLAVSYAKTGNYEQARQILKQINEGKEFGEHVAYYIAGELAQIQRDYTGARQQFEKAVQLDSQNARYKHTLARLYLILNSQGLAASEQRRNYENAIALLNETVQLSPYDPAVLNDLGKAYYDFGMLYESEGNLGGQQMYQSSLMCFKKIVDMQAQDIDVLINMGILSGKLQKTADADRYYTQALNLDSNNSRANLVYGLFKLEQKDYTGACRYLEKTVQLNKNAGDAAVARSKINELREKGWLS